MPLALPSFVRRLLLLLLLLCSALLPHLAAADVSIPPTCLTLRSLGIDLPGAACLEFSLSSCEARSLHIKATLDNAVLLDTTITEAATEEELCQPGAFCSVCLSFDRDTIDIDSSYAHACPVLKLTCAGVERTAEFPCVTVGDKCDVASCEACAGRERCGWCPVRARCAFAVAGALPGQPGSDTFVPYCADDCDAAQFVLSRDQCSAGGGGDDDGDGDGDGNSRRDKKKHGGGVKIVLIVVGCCALVVAAALVYRRKARRGRDGAAGGGGARSHRGMMPLGDMDGDEDGDDESVHGHLTAGLVQEQDVVLNPADEAGGVDEAPLVGGAV